MYLQMLSQEQQKLFLSLAVLLKISDDEILWEGKTLDEVTPTTNFEDVSFVTSKEEIAILNRYLSELDKVETLTKNDLVGFSSRKSVGTIGAGTTSPLFMMSLITSSIYHKGNINNRFINYLSKYPVHKQNEQETRLKVIDEIFNDMFYSEIESLEISPASAKIIIYELQILSLADNQVSLTEKNIIDRLSLIFNIDDYIKEELLECAVETSKQVTKTLALILE